MHAPFWAPSALHCGTRCIFGLLFVQGLVGCGDSGSMVPAATEVATVSAAPAREPAAQPWQGHFIGTVTMAAGQFYGDALLTVDGAVRVYVGGPYDGDGTVQQSRADGATQFIGTIQGNGNQASGSGVVIGLNCAAPAAAGRFCLAPVQTQVAISSGASDGQIQGELHLTTNGGDEIWSMDMVALDNYYLLPATRTDVAGKLQETLAEFAGNGITTVTVDDDGMVSFHSADSGCVGNGTVAPHRDGQFNVYDVALTLESCQAGYAYLNGSFSGFATTSPSSVWDYDSSLRIWLATATGAPSPAALIMFSH